MSYANVRIILLEKNIQCPMQIVFYCPVTALHLQEFFSCQAFAAIDEPPVAGSGGLARLGSFRTDERCPMQSRPILTVLIPGQIRKQPTGALFYPTMIFVHCLMK